MIKYGEKTKLYKENLPIICDRHGEHTNWKYNEKFKQIICLECHKERTNKFKSSDDYVFTKFITWSKARCVKSGRNFNIDVDYIKKIYIKQEGLCNLSKIELNEDNLSLDRIDSSKGYIVGNIQWLDFNVNRMKTDLKQNEFIKICKLIALSNNQKITMAKGMDKKKEKKKESKESKKHEKMEMKGMKKGKMC